MRRLLLLLLLPVLALILASCGGGYAPVSGHVCSPGHFYQQCVGKPTAKLIAPKGHGNASVRLGDFGLFGIDFAWGQGPWGSRARQLGVRYGASYLSNSSKDWTWLQIHSYVNAGLGVVFVWETSATRPLDGFNAGYDDAFNATHEAARLGFTSHVHINFAADFDTTGRYDFVPYYQGAAAWDRRVGVTTGAYGGLNTVRTLCQRGITTQNWQTLAWSYGQWASPSCAPLRQVGINNNFAGYSVDYNRAVASNYGQTGYATVPPVVCFGPHASNSKACQAKRHRAAVLAAEVNHIRFVSVFHYKCLERYPRRKHGHFVRWGRNYHRDFCVTLRRRVRADNQIILSLHR